MKQKRPASGVTGNAGHGAFLIFVWGTSGARWGHNRVSPDEF